MPRKCVTLFDGKKCRTNYAATKTLPAGEKLPVYRFPRSPEEQKRWLDSLPNVPQEITEHVGICSNHFPQDCPTVSLPGGALRPSQPPSMFGTTNPLLCPQTLNSTPRNVDARNVSAETRYENARKLEVELDRIDSWENMVNYCLKFSPDLLVDTSSYSVLRVVKLTSESPPSVEFSVIIDRNYHVEAYKGTNKVSIRDLVEGFGITVQNYSHIDAVVQRLRKGIQSLP